MDFYTQMSIHYDEIFKFSMNKLVFLKDNLPSGSRVLDVGCGTGTYSAPFAMEGYHVIATDLDEAMLKLAENHYKRLESESFTRLQGSHIVKKMNLTQLAQTFSLEQKFDLIYCIGNTLPHVNEKEAIQFIETGLSYLADSGRLVLQFVNYEKALQHLAHHETLNFSVVEFGDQRRFERGYKLIQGVEEGEANIAFEAHFVKCDENGVETRTTGMTRLFAITKEKIESWLLSLGCSRFDFYGDFDRNPYHIESPALVVEVFK